MVIRTAWIVAGPPDDDEIAMHRFDLWPFGDLDVRGRLCRREYLSVSQQRGVDGL
jgi:hypothetical protein